MALLCPAGALEVEDGRHCSGVLLQTVEVLEQEDSMLPLLLNCHSGASPGSSFSVEHEQAVSKALVLLSEQLDQLKVGSKALNRTETSELLRDTCQALAELSTGLEERWRRGCPNEPMPSWAVNAVPEEELAQIGWDFHANRVQIKMSGSSMWEILSSLFNQDPEAGYFAKPPSAEAVSDALARVVARFNLELSAAGGA